MKQVPFRPPDIWQWRLWGLKSVQSVWNELETVRNTEKKSVIMRRHLRLEKIEATFRGNMTAAVRSAEESRSTHTLT